MNPHAPCLCIEQGIAHRDVKLENMLLLSADTENAPMVIIGSGLGPKSRRFGTKSRSQRNRFAPNCGLRGVASDGRRCGALGGGQVLIDFGLGRHFASDERGQPQTRSLEGTVGSYHYIAPEVLSGPYTESCDIWSAGVAAYVERLCPGPLFLPTFLF